jgi:hypothetical protein
MKLEYDIEMICSLNEGLECLVVVFAVFRDYFVEVAFGVVDEISGRVEFPDFALIQYHDSVVVDYGIQSVGYCDYSCVFKFLSNHLLNHKISFLVDIRSRLNYYSLLRPSATLAIS